MADPLKFGQEKPASGGRAARRAFESTGGTRAAVRRGGTVGRGNVHYQAYEDLSARTGVSYNTLIDENYDPVTGKYIGKIKEGFTSRSGEFSTREKFGKSRGMGKYSQYTSAEQTAKETGELDLAERRRIARAEGSIDPADQARRRNRAKRTHGYLEKMKEEEKLLRSKRPNPRKSPEGLRKLELDAKTAVPGASRGFRDAVRTRLRLIDRRKGVLKALGRKAGLLGLVASPYTTGEALVGLGSKDRNTRLRSVEILQGLPDFSTGRGLTEKEKKEIPVWNNPTTGEWKI